jgi:predicted nucleic acid-binding protein
LLLLDNSAWSRLLAGTIPPDGREKVIAWMEAERLGVCQPFLLEAGYSARSARDHGEMIDRLLQLPRLGIDDEVEQAALQAQRKLAKVGHHRLAPSDLVIAACADRAGGGVLHYDRDYDLIAAHADLDFESVWIAAAGTLR